MNRLGQKMLSMWRRGLTTVKTKRSFKVDPLANLALLEEGLAPHLGSIGPERHKAVVRRLLISYHEAKAAQQHAPAAYQPGAEWGTAISVRYAAYLRALREHDAESLGNLLKNFFRNGAATDLGMGAYQDEDASRGRRGIANSRTVDKQAFVNRLLQQVATWKEHVDHPDVRTLAAPRIGNPWGYIVEGQLILPVSGRLHYYASRANALLVDIPRPVVAEIGGGFGGFAYYLLSMGRGYTYLDFDLPEVLLVAQYYLMNAFPEKKFLLFGETQDPGISEEVLASYDVILMPNFQLPQLPPNSVDLFLNTESLSEMAYQAVEEYIAQITRTCRMYFLHENKDHARVQFWTQSVEVPAHMFPLGQEMFKKIMAMRSIWFGGFREYLYQRLKTHEESCV